MVQYALRDLEDWPEIAKALGNMTVAWAYAEDNLVIAMHKVSGMRANMALAAYHSITNFESRIQMIIAATNELKIGERGLEKETLIALLAKFRRLHSTRNRYTHQAWQTDREQVYIVNMRGSSANSKSTIAKASDIEQHTAAVQILTSELAMAVGDLGEL